MILTSDAELSALLERSRTIAAAGAAGLDVVVDRCIKIDLARLAR